MADMKKLLHTFDEADEILNGKIERTNLSTIVASATASVENKKTVLIRGTGRNIESLKVGGRTVQDGTPTPDAPVEVKGVGDKTVNLWKYGDISATAATSVFDHEPFALPAGSYTITMDTNSSIGIGVRFFYVDGDNDQSVVVSVAPNNPKVQFTLEKPTVTFNCATGGAGQVKNIQIQKGSTATPYEPYGKYKIPVSCNGETTNIYLDAPLFDGEVADLVSGKAEKKWGMINLEDISWTIEGNYWIGKTPVGFKKAASPDIPFSGYCSTFKIVAINPLSASMTAIAVVAAGDMFYVSNQSKTDKPVGILVYELISSVSESFDGASIPTTAAEQEVNINTELVPSSIEAVTFGDYYTKSEVDKMMIDAVVGRREFLSSTLKDFIEITLTKTTYKQFVTTGNKTSVTDSPIVGWATFRFEKITDTQWTIVATSFAGDAIYMGNYNAGTITMKQVSN